MPSDDQSYTPDEPLPAAQRRMPESKTVVVRLDELSELAVLRQENARYRIAQEFHRRVTLERSVEAMIDRILEVIFDLLTADGAAIWLQDQTCVSKARDGQTITVPTTVIQSTLKSSNGVLTHDALVDQRFDRSKSMMVRGIQSVMAVPLRTRSGTLGLLYVESVSMQAAFSTDDLALLDSIAAQAAMLLDNAQLLAQVEQEVERRVALSRFLSPAAVDEVLSGRMNVEVAGHIADVTLLFADLRGFTTLSAHMRPPQVVNFLNQFFTQAVATVERHNGTIDKFIGDCVMAMWGAPVPRPDDTRNAVKAALEIVERAKSIKVMGKPLEVGVGIHSGPAVVGAIGSSRRSDYTAVGSTVNVAARLCSIAQTNEVLITSDTLLGAGPGLTAQAKEPLVLKGLEVPIVPYTVTQVAQPLMLNQPVRSGATRRK
jgi:adenylate cyclase